MPPFNLLHSLSQDVSRWVDVPLPNLAAGPTQTSQLTPSHPNFLASVTSITTSLSLDLVASMAVLFQGAVQSINKLYTAVPIPERPACMLLPMGSPWTPASCMFVSATDVPVLCAAVLVIFLVVFRFCAGRYAVRPSS